MIDQWREMKSRNPDRVVLIEDDDGNHYCVGDDTRYAAWMSSAVPCDLEEGRERIRAVLIPASDVRSVIQHCVGLGLKVAVLERVKTAPKGKHVERIVTAGRIP